MTLTLSVLTPGCVYQASDRPDDENAVVWCRSLAFTCTGPGLAAGERTDLWLAKALAEVEEEAARGRMPRDQAWLLSRLAERATAEVGRLTTPAASWRHAFVGVGWARFDGSSSFTPYRALVSNFHEDREGESTLVESPSPRPRFDVHTRALGAGDAGVVEAVPSALPPERVQTLIQDLKRADESGAGATAMIRVLGDEIRRTARSNPQVGRDLLAHAIPRAAVDDGDATFLSVAAGSWEVEASEPTRVCGGVVSSGFTSR